MAQHTVVLVLRLYRATLSPALGFVCGGLGLGCRFNPTCSQYALQAVQQHGVIKGVVLAAKRLTRCHPWGGSGYDPVPCRNEEGRMKNEEAATHKAYLRRLETCDTAGWKPALQGETHGS